ncbi:hypothetical protein AUJ14_02310 [Candidatus Micrarchaeota archaeon CG1_02_55_22]|nr:MAG: hypothetical protein AUJ14_02310 [Candidatus Micrarchaeota archaeon CG1_02_55_22]
MKMNYSSTIKIPFADKETADKAALVVKGDDISPRSKLEAEANKNVLTLNIGAEDFTALRARTTSALRDLRVFVDSTDELSKGGK